MGIWMGSGDEDVNKWGQSHQGDRKREVCDHLGYRALIRWTVACMRDDGVDTQKYFLTSSIRKTDLAI